jgi:MFS family permease
MRARSLVLAVAAGLVLADASIVTLALPAVLRELDTTVEGVAAVIGVYTVVLAVALLPAERVARRVGPARTAGAGLLIFAAASLACGLAGSLGFLLTARAVQALGGSGALIGVFAFLVPAGDDRARARRLWLGVAVLSTAVGPALGGALTELFSWQAIFLAQVPVALVAAVLCLREAGADWVAWTPAPLAVDRGNVRAGLALALVSAALTAVLFLLVLLLVAGWNVAPLRAAVAVTIIPLGALLGARVGGDAQTKAAAGCVLAAAGTIALAFLPNASLWWTVVPQALAGLGMGLALPALAGELLPERDARDAAALLTLRHAGIALALLALAPVVATQLDDATDRARERGVALVLDARLPPTAKLTLAPSLLGGVDADEPRKGLRAAVDRARPSYSGQDAVVFDRLAQRADDTLITAVGEAFDDAFLITGVLALLAALAVAPLRPRPTWLAVGAAAALAAPLAYAVLHDRRAPEPIALSDPCLGRPLPSTGGLTGLVQDRALQLLDQNACKYGSTREELVLALTDEADARRFEQRHGHNPRSIENLLGGLLGG